MPKLLLLLFITTFFLLHFSNYSYGQMKNPVTWEFHAGKIANNLYEVDCHAFIGTGWHIYPLKMGDEEIGVATRVIFEPNPYLKVVDTLEEKGSMTIKHVKLDEDIIVHYYEDQVIFSQYFSLKGNVKQTTLKGRVLWQSCTSEQCLPVISKDFTIIINKE